MSKVRSRTRSRKSPFQSVFVTEIVGMRYRFKSDQDYSEQFFKLVPGTEVTVRRDRQNKHDRYACGVYLNRCRIGYLPAFLGRQLAKRLDAGEKFRFIIFDLSQFYMGFEGLPATTLLGFSSNWLERT